MTNLDMEVKVFRRYKLCGCGGHFEATGEGTTQLKTIWKHICTQCKKIEGFEKTYPCIVYEEIT